MKRLRCAVYTRKSTEDGLDQDFNSLDAQREACEAYVKSQAGEGWMLVKTRYDDGGVSGGTLERPGLQALLADIQAGKVNVVVTYKVDRLTRSLSDFARLVDLFDEHGVSFVSVTQQFNTTTSMGRLTLNVLLSFAQFEREVTAERIRDKIAASKKKGLWMGGVVPLGYNIEERKLVVNPAEADTVRTLFRLYLEHGTVPRVQQEAHRLGLRTKTRAPNNGKRQGGAPFTRGHLYQLLANPIYLGEIAHKGTHYAGKHEAIVDRKLWEAVQAQLSRNAAKRHHATNAKNPSLLAGLLHDGAGRPMKPAHAKKAGRRYRYYITRQPQEASCGAEAVWRLPAPALDEAVLTGVCAFLEDRRRLTDALDLALQPSGRLKAMLSKAARLGARLRGAGPAQKRALLIELVERVDVHRDRIRITLRAESLITLTGQTTDPEGKPNLGTVSLDVPIRIRRRGAEVKLVIADERARAPTPDPRLIAAVAKGHAWFEELRSGPGLSVQALVDRYGVDQGDVSRALPLAFLAPDIVAAILAGRQPIQLTAARLKRMRLPLSWAEQRHLLGLAG